MSCGKPHGKKMGPGGAAGSEKKASKPKGKK